MTEKKPSLKELAANFSDIITPDIWARALAEHEEAECTYIERMNAKKQNPKN